jgi:polysaccharide export outer membrane protein
LTLSAPRRRWWLASALCLSITGCGGPPPLATGNEPRAAVQTTELPPPEAIDLIPVGSDFLVGPLDRLSVVVFGVAELSAEVQADAAGNIALPLIGQITVTGKSPTQIADELALKYRAAHVRNPIVTVTLRESVNQTVTVDGQVKEPGVYPVLPNMSLTKAVATAKGADEFAKIEDVVVFRTVSGRRMAALYNLGAIRRGVYDDPRIYPNDLVVVGDSQSRRLFRDALQAVPLIAGPLILLLQN